MTQKRAAYVGVACPNCGGHGVVSDYRGGDFNGAMDCPDCGGSGGIVVYASGRCALWPGGPFCGSWPGEYERAMARRTA